MSFKQSTAGDINEGDTMVIDDEPCRVKDIQTSKPGKHGSTKCRITAVGIIDGNKRKTVMPADERVKVPIVDKKTAQVLNISEDTAQVMDMESYQNFDIEIPEELKDEIEEGKKVLYWEIMDHKMIKEVKGE